MDIVDLRDRLHNCNDAIIEVGEDCLYYAREENAPGGPLLTLLARDTGSGKERLLCSYQLRKADYIPHYFSFPHWLLVVMENGGPQVWLLRVDKGTGQSRLLRHASLQGNCTGCLALDANRVLLYTLQPEPTQETAGAPLRREAVLYDAKEDELYAVADPRLLQEQGLLPFSGGGESRLLVLPPQPGENRQRALWLEGGDCGSYPVWQCKVRDLCKGADPFTCLLRAQPGGRLDFVGRDAQSLYFRALRFGSGDQRLLAVSRHNSALRCVAWLTLRAEEASARFAFSDGKGYRLSQEGSWLHVQGILNSTLDARCPAALGRFVGCLEDRFLLLESSTVSNAPCCHVYDCCGGGLQSFTGCRWRISGSTLVLY